MPTLVGENYLHLMKVELELLFNFIKVISTIKINHNNQATSHEASSSPRGFLLVSIAIGGYKL